MIKSDSDNNIKCQANGTLIFGSMRRFLAKIEKSVN